MTVTFSLKIPQALLILSVVTAPSMGAQIPGTIEVQISNRLEPMWQSAKAVSTREGEVDWRRFSDDSRRELQEMAAENRKSALRAGKAIETPGEVVCENVFGVPHTERIVPKPNRSLRDLVTHSEAILRGHIVDIEAGFIDGLPSSLLQIEVDEEPRTAPGVAAGGPVYLAYPFARFRVGETSFCTGIETSYQPQIGDGVFLFLYERPLDEESVLLIPELEEMFFEVDGQLVLPHNSAMGSAARTARNLADLSALVRTEFERTAPAHKVDGGEN